MLCCDVKHKHNKVSFVVGVYGVIVLYVLLMVGKVGSSFHAGPPASYPENSLFFLLLQPPPSPHTPAQGQSHERSLH